MDLSTTTASPQLRFHNSASSETTAWQQLQSKPGVDRTSYYIVKDSESGSNTLKLSSGDFEDGNHGNPDLIVGIHIQSSGTIFIEALHHKQDVRLARETKPKSSRPVKRPLPCSKPPKERMLVLLDSDAAIFVNGETIFFELGTSSIPTIDGEGDIAMEVDEPQVLVEQSYPQESLKRGESDMVQSTPAIPETVTEEPRVHETPSVKSRFMNPDSATVTLPGRGMPREDTFGDIEQGGKSTPKGNKATSARSLKSGLIFGSHSHERPGTSDEEETGRKTKSLGKKFDGFGATPRKENKNSTAVATMGAIDNVITLDDTEDEEKENRNSTEVMRRRFSESAMITSFGSAMDEVVSEVASPVIEEEEEEEEGKLVDEANTPKNHIKKHGVPEGFLYEEHKKDTTPKQVYGKNKRRGAPVPKEKKAADKEKRSSNELVGSANDSEDELLQNPQSKKRRAKRTREINATDESEEEEVEILPQNRKGTASSEERRDAAMETADDEDEAAPPPRTQRGRRTVHSLPSTAATTEDDIVKTKRGVRGKKVIPTKNAGKATERNKESDAEEKAAEFSSTAKPVRGRRGSKKLSDAPENVFSTAPEEAPKEISKISLGANSTQPTRKRRRSGDIDEKGENLSRPTTREGTVESTIQVAEQPKQKRAKTTPVKKAPATKRGKKKDVTPPPPESSGKVLGDTQYTIQITQTQTQTQTLDQAEAKTPKAAKKKATPQARKSTTRKKKTDSQPLETEGDSEDEVNEAHGRSTRTKDRYEGDAPKIVFSNSGLDERKDIEKFLRANGGKKMQNVSAPGVNFLVVGPGELKRTPKLTVGVALGKYVVEDQWLIDSKEIGYFLDPDQYIPYDPTHEKAWSFSLTAAITRGRKGLNCILKDHNVYITSSLLSQLKASKQEESLVEMLKAAGAGTITKRCPKCKKEDDSKAEQTLILGTEKGDSDVTSLEKAGWAVYGTGIVAISVLRGKLDVGEEFRISIPEVEASQKVGRGRKGK